MKHTYKLFIFTTLCVSSFLGSCELYNPAEPIPSYIHIDKIDLIKNPKGFPTTITGDEGSLSHKISDAWVYIDEKLIGCFELPATFPVLYEGIHQVKIRAGIKVNGISSNRAPYPFYDNFLQTVNLQSGTKVILSPTVMYRSNVKFDFLENFDLTGMIVGASPESDTTLQKITFPPENVFEGANSAVTYLDATHIFCEFTTTNNYVLPKGGADVFLEFNYKCNYPFTVGIIAYGSASFERFASLHMNPSETWNKAYVYMTPAISGAYSAINYKIAWGAVNNNGADSIAILIDNIKLMH